MSDAIRSDSEQLRQLSRDYMLGDVSLLEYRQRRRHLINLHTGEKDNPAINTDPVEQEEQEDPTQPAMPAVSENVQAHVSAAPQQAPQQKRQGFQDLGWGLWLVMGGVLAIFILVALFFILQ